jgi:hypothetical protein
MYLHNNRLTSLHQSIRNLKKLRLLTLTGNMINAQERARIRAWMPDTDIRYE